jgi:DNA-binding CsgD family transcriptional regulator
MTDAKFAEELSRVLGPMYRIHLTDEAGRTLAAFGRGSGSDRSMVKISLPNSANALLIGIDLDAIAASDRLLHELAATHTLIDTPLGALAHLDEALDQLIAQGEAHIGRPLGEMSRTEKQILVRFLDDRGAFSIRKSVERVADILGVSRFTVYNYLDAVREK